MLTDPEKIDARRFMGYPVLGTSQVYQMANANAVDYRLANLSSAEETVLRQYLTTLGGLEQSIPDAAVGLDTRSAGEWVRNPTELADRTRLLDDWRRRLCAFLGIPPGPDLSGRGQVALVV